MADRVPIVLKMLQVNVSEPISSIQVIVDKRVVHTFPAPAASPLDDLVRGKYIKFFARSAFSKITITVCRRNAVSAKATISRIKHIVASDREIIRTFTWAHDEKQGEVRLKLDLDEFASLSQQQLSPQGLSVSAIPTLELLRKILAALERISSFNQAAYRLCRFYLGSSWWYLQEHIHEQLAENNSYVQRNVVDVHDMHHNVPHDLLLQIESQLDFVNAMLPIVDEHRRAQLEPLLTEFFDVIADGAPLIHAWSPYFIGACYAQVKRSARQDKGGLGNFFRRHQELLNLRLRMILLWHPTIDFNDTLPQSLTFQAFNRLVIERAAHEAQGSGATIGSDSTSFCALLFCYKGELAQMAFERMHGALSSCTDDHSQRDVLRRLMARLAISANRLPESYVLQPSTVRIDRTSKKRPVAEGGYAIVRLGHYAALEDYYSKRVAVKELKAEVAKNKSQTFLEIINSRTLKHDNLIQLIGFLDFNDMGTISLVFPWMEHGASVSYLRKLKEERTRSDLTELSNEWILDIARALAYLHAESIAHGDIRGGNILIAKDEHAVLADFGLSVYVNAHSREYHSTRSGNVGWLAPEQNIDGQSGRPTFASDVYSFALSCVEMYTGNQPWYPSAIPKMVLPDDRPGQPRNPDNSGDMDSELWTLITRCWAQEPDARMRAPDVVAELEHILL